MGIKAQQFFAELVELDTVCLDTSLLIYHLNKDEPYSLLTEHVFDACANASLRGFISVISVSEFAVKPFEANRLQEITHFEQLVSSLGIGIIETTYQIAKDAARLSGTYGGVKLADALIVSSALNYHCDGLITNDKDLKKLEAEGITVVILSDFVEYH